MTRSCRFDYHYKPKMEFRKQGGARDEILAVGHDARFRSKAALTRTHSKTCRIFISSLRARSVLECVRVGALSLRATPLYPNA